MLRLLEDDAHGLRLRSLLGRFRDQEVELVAALGRLGDALEATEDSTCAVAGRAVDAHRAQVARCIELQLACDGVSIELVHVRMAIAGTLEELADHDHRRFLAAHAAPDGALAAPA
jgi:hypothetical protein